MSLPNISWIALLVGLTLTAGNALAGQPSLAFDFGRTAECREILADDTHTLSSNQQLAPNQKLVELKLRLSVRLLNGKMGDVDEVRIEISDCDSRIRVDSFLPITRLESRLSQDIVWTETTEKGKSLSASLGGEAALPMGDVVAQVLPNVKGGLTNRKVLVETQVRRAPRYAVVTSGTIAQEHGVFFKLRASPQSTLEGSHVLTVRFVVPKNWRGDALRVCCQATGQEKFLWSSQQATWSHTCSPLAIYLAGDREARFAAERHVGRKSL